MISIVLVEPKNSGNVGAIARSMANFGFSKLVLVNPKCNHLSQTARNRAKWAQVVLKKAKVVKKIPKFDTLVATTAKIGTDYNIPRSPISPEKLSSVCKGNIGIIFGRESTGLTNEEIQQADFVVTIPASKKYPVMNLSHSVAIILYELSKEDHTSHIILASKKEKEQILKMINKVLNKLSFATKEKKQTQKIVWKRTINKSFLTKREAFAIMGFFRKLL
ncbi:TrmJ/YjtD family RNA methyltransferase [Candidatus Woesearchaeota archaeon]|nr:TrmJ/YjtD family RNA methyltransferase [Candidatus Woesearchaeota archaeon]